MGPPALDAASKIGGSTFSALVHKSDSHGDRWALTCRWEIHPDHYDMTAELFNWLAKRCIEPDLFFGYLRWYEHDWPDEKLGIRDGILVVHRATGTVEPFGEPE